MERWIGKVALVTGASSGIGLAIVQKLVSEGVKVIGVARRKERLDKTAEELYSSKGKFFPFQGDVSKEEDIVNCFEWTKNNVGPVSVLVNNAGIFRSGSLWKGPSKIWKDTFDVNVMGLCIGTGEAIKQMKEHNIDGHIININSVAGHKVVPGRTNVYSASKYAVTALSETLRLELAREGSKIKVTSLSPGTVRTEIFEQGNISTKRLQSMKKTPQLEASQIADAAVYVLSTPPEVQISELTIQPVGEAA